MAIEYRVRTSYSVSNIQTDYPYDPADAAASIKDYLDEQAEDDFELCASSFASGQWVFIKKTVL